MDEMKQVVSNVPALVGQSLARAKAVEAAFGHNDGANEDAIRAEFDAMLAVA
jgi:beta-N-acetylhexosaminidase